ncbi:MAG: hypothetical protein AAGJ81_06270 [Verrucomicrobiota bacterium]
MNYPKTFTSFLLITMVIGAGFSCSSRKNDVSKQLVEQRYSTEEDFTRISEFFTGREPVGGRVYLRTSPDSREGYYWIVPSEDLPDQPSVAKLTVQLPGSPEWIHYEFPISEAERERSVFWLGITGEDWPGRKFHPIAWQLSFQSEEGTVLYSRDSFLWTPEVKIVAADDPSSGEVNESN